MTSNEESLQQIRTILITLLEGAEAENWSITYSALQSGRKILPRHNGHFGAYAVNSFILNLLRTGFPMHEVKLGSGQPAFVMNNADEQGLYIKLKIEDEMAAI